MRLALFFAKALSVNNCKSFMCVLLGLIFVYQVNVSASPDPVSGLLACSDNMFVHNNSKHGRKSRKVDSTYGEF